MTDIHSFYMRNKVIYMNKGWLYVVLTCTFELLWVGLFAKADSLLDWLLIAVLLIVDFNVLIKACELLPTGTVYAVFSAVGTIGTALMDIFLFGADFTIYKGFFMLLLVLGVISLKIADNHAEGGV